LINKIFFVIYVLINLDLLRQWASHLVLVLVLVLVSLNFMPGIFNLEARSIRIKRSSDTFPVIAALKLEPNYVLKLFSAKSGLVYANVQVIFIASSALSMATARDDIIKSNLVFISIA